MLLSIKHSGDKQREENYDQGAEKFPPLLVLTWIIFISKKKSIAPELLKALVKHESLHTSKMKHKRVKVGLKSTASDALSGQR